MKKAVIAMSGGVDSSVAAKIMKDRGYSCIGATMELFDKSCFSGCSSQDTDDARSIAEKLDFPFYVFDLSRDFEEQVIKKFIHTYETGGTPNPCVDCNKNLKFGRLFEKAMELGCDCIATGHYAMIEEKNGRFALKKAADPAKDQSYVLYSLSQRQLSHTIFPLGNLSKEHVRKVACDNGFLNAQKKESQDICFVPNGDYAAFIENFMQKKYPKGRFIDKKGNILGTHNGIIRYTIGQRRGLGLSLSRPMYVCEINAKENTVTLCTDEELFTSEVSITHFNWVSMANPDREIRAEAKIRYNMAEQSCRLIPVSETEIKIIFDRPQRAVTKGQAAVIYQDQYVIGGGTIC